MTKKEAKQVIKELEKSGGFVYPAEDSKKGITRRNECADRIAAGIASSWLISGEKFLKPSGVAQAAYELADAMIVEGRKEKE